MCLCLSICVSVSLCNYVLWAISLCAGMYMPMCTYLGMPLPSMALSSSLYRLAQVPPLPEAMAGVGPGETGLNSPAVDSRIYRAPSRT